jgi:hypothetical protein
MMNGNLLMSQMEKRHAFEDAQVFYAHCDDDQGAD